MMITLENTGLYFCSLMYKLHYLDLKRKKKQKKHESLCPAEVSKSSQWSTRSHQNVTLPAFLPWCTILGFEEASALYSFFLDYLFNSLFFKTNSTIQSLIHPLLLPPLSCFIHRCSPFHPCLQFLI